MSARFSTVFFCRHIFDTQSTLLKKHKQNNVRTMEQKFAIEFKGSNHLKQKLILATLSGKSIRVTDIRKETDGLQEFEVNLIRLIDKLTNGTQIKLGKSGTELEFTPGILQGGKIEHQCCVEKSIGELFFHRVS